ncbi:hypothetical protein BV210_02460 [Halorientalis sp. IM1011]|uniref:hypothetical protein n=1 Tax=Halorientalis sp. IM1011 TaxID=1932360 RepID=UPI00097CD29E|nr:hypothetical protein [Halorientalis sp. IM1011]AQL41645.1 hypothetical protein BV210_02460 [Halorientalis sp. IM1011]
MLYQATEDRPTQLRTRLENQHTEPVSVSFGPALLFTDNAASDDLEWPDQLVIDPETNIGPWGNPTQDAEGCWRFPDDQMRAVQSILQQRELAAGDSITETYSLYTFGTSGSCLPKGTYRFQDKGYLRGEDTPLLFTLAIDIDGDQQVTVNGSQTEVSMY